MPQPRLNSSFGVEKIWRHIFHEYYTNGGTLACEASECNVFAEKSCRCPASHNFTCFSQGQHSKDVQLQDGVFFLGETLCLVVISQAIFSDGALKKFKEPISPHQAQAQGCYATGPSPWWFSHSFSGIFRELVLGRN